MPPGRYASRARPLRGHILRKPRQRARAPWRPPGRRSRPPADTRLSLDVFIDAVCALLASPDAAAIDPTQRALLAGKLAQEVAGRARTQPVLAFLDAALPEPNNGLVTDADATFTLLSNALASSPYRTIQDEPSILPGAHGRSARPNEAQPTTPSWAPDRQRTIGLSFLDPKS